jgi:hypothetical protein
LNISRDTRSLATLYFIRSIAVASGNPKDGLAYPKSTLTSLLTQGLNDQYDLFVKDEGNDETTRCCANQEGNRCEQNSVQRKTPHLLPALFVASNRSYLISEAAICSSAKYVVSSEMRVPAKPSQSSCPGQYEAHPFPSIGQRLGQMVCVRIVLQVRASSANSHHSASGRC